MSTLTTSFLDSPSPSFILPSATPIQFTPKAYPQPGQYGRQDGGSTGRGILIVMLSAFGSAIFVGLILTLVYFLRFTQRGRILLDRMGRPGQFDDEQAFLREEAEALETMDDSQRSEYLRAKGSLQRASYSQ